MGMMFKFGMAKMNDYYTAAAKMNATIIEYVNGKDVVKVFGRDGESYRRYENDITSYRDFTLEWYKICWPWMALYSALIPCVALVMLPVGTLMVINGTVTLADLVLVFCLTLSIGVPLLKALNFAGKIPQLNYKVDEIEKAMDNEPLKTNNNAFTGNSHSVTFDDVRFAYKEQEVLHGVSLELGEGTLTALVGESGSGKSTLAKLLVHYYDLNGGRITLGGQDITDMRIEALNDQISYVSQEQFLFNTTLYENILIGKPDAAREEVMAAAEKAQCSEFLARLPMGFFTEGNIGRISSVLSTDMVFIEENCMSVLADMMSYLFSQIIMIVFMFLFDWRLGAASLAVTGRMILLGGGMMKSDLSHSKERQDAAEIQTEAVLDFTEGIGIIKTYNLLGEKSKELTDSFARNCRVNLTFEEEHAPWARGVNIIYAAGTVLVLALSTFLYFRGAMPLNYYIGMLLFLFDLFVPFKTFYDQEARLTVMSACLDRMADKLRIVEGIIKLADFFGKGYRLCGNWLDKDKKARDQDGSILYEFYHYNEHELEYKIHTCAYVKLFEHYHIRKFCKAFFNNDLCMCVLHRSAKFIRFSDRVDGDYCHDKLINLSR